MYRVEYCDDPNNIQLIKSERIYQDSIEKKYQEKMDSVDQYIMLIDMFRIIESCSEDFIETLNLEDTGFWRINKALLNYVNAVFSLREYVKNYKPSIKVINEKYYKKRKWYRFICEFRNRVIHQSIFIKEYNPEINDAWIDINEMIKIQNKVRIKSERQRDNKEIFNKVLEELKAESHEFRGKNYLSMRYVIVAANIEINHLKEEILEYAFEKTVKKDMQWFISQMEVVNGEYKYTFIVNSSNLPESVLEPNYTFEGYVKEIVERLGFNNGISREIGKLLEDNNYGKFFN